jgi:hypothetical protein
MLLVALQIKFDKTGLTDDQTTFLTVIWNELDLEWQVRSICYLCVMIPGSKKISRMRRALAVSPFDIHL